MKNKVYLASTWFDETPNTYDDQRQRLHLAHQALLANPTIGHIYSPSEHQSNIKPMFGHEWRTETFNADVRHVYNSDVVVALLDYNTNGCTDDGIAFELGCAYTSNTPIVAVSIHHDGKVNLMIADSVTAYLDNIDDLATYDFDELPPVRVDEGVI